MLVLGLLLAVGSVGGAEASIRVSAHHRERAVHRIHVAYAPVAGLRSAPHAAGSIWEGRDIDGDGEPDFANPTGGAPRGHDAFGDGAFHASRDGGSRPHEGVDYDARPGQTVVAPISGVVSRIGYAYPGDTRLRYVEIENPALRLDARALYVAPSVRVGEAVQLGEPIGRAVSLQRRYPGITNHVHLEIAENGRKIDAETMIFARREGGALMAAMN